LQQLIRPTTQNQKSEYEKSGMYKITCKAWHKSYVRQTSRIWSWDFRNTRVI
jgi:hypothetical protein